MKVRARQPPILHSSLSPIPSTSPSCEQLLVMFPEIKLTKISIFQTQKYSKMKTLPAAARESAAVAMGAMGIVDKS